MCLAIPRDSSTPSAPAAYSRASAAFDMRTNELVLTESSSEQNFFDVGGCMHRFVVAHRSATQSSGTSSIVICLRRSCGEAGCDAHFATSSPTRRHRSRHHVADAGASLQWHWIRAVAGAQRMTIESIGRLP
jgi:hypothetical protein